MTYLWVLLAGIEAARVLEEEGTDGFSKDGGDSSWILSFLLNVYPTRCFPFFGAAPGGMFHPLGQEKTGNGPPPVGNHPPREIGSSGKPFLLETKPYPMEGLSFLLMVAATGLFFPINLPPVKALDPRISCSLPPHQHLQREQNNKSCSTHRALKWKGRSRRRRKAATLGKHNLVKNLSRDTA